MTTMAANSHFDAPATRRMRAIDIISHIFRQIQDSWGQLLF